MLITSILFNFITKIWATRVGEREREREREREIVPIKVFV